MRQYLQLMQHVLDTGVRKSDRTGTGTRSLFGEQLKVDLGNGFPLLTTKHLHLKSIIHELLWFIAGETNISYLHERGVRIWDEWADENGDLGPIYGHQGRSWPDPESGDGHIDQLLEVINSIQHDPDSRRLIISAWNVSALKHMALAPCHAMFQFYVAENRLSCQLYQRSADLFLGVPFNIASYSLLTMMVAQVTGLRPGTFVHTFGDVHLYENHLEQAREQLGRTPSARPTMHIDPTVHSISEFQFEHFSLRDYEPQPHIAAPVAV